ncbi:hypothetical protein CsSME_00042965 [Camellia sinensis var. sinensis]
MSVPKVRTELAKYSEKMINARNGDRNSPGYNTWKCGQGLKNSFKNYGEVRVWGWRELVRVWWQWQGFWRRRVRVSFEINFYPSQMPT